MLFTDASARTTFVWIAYLHVIMVDILYRRNMLDLFLGEILYILPVQYPYFILRTVYIVRVLQLYIFVQAILYYVRPDPSRVCMFHT